MSKVNGLFGTYEVKRLVTSAQVGKWCRLSYPGHKRGCPNYGRPNCPPGAGSIVDVIDTTQPMYLVSAMFNLKYHAELMKIRHSGWSDRQCRNVLYWQQIVRADLRRAVKAAMGFLGCDVVTYCPEGFGVNVFVTARAAGLKLDKTRRIWIDHHVALIGTSIAAEAQRTGKEIGEQYGESASTF